MVPQVQKEDVRKYAYVYEEHKNRVFAHKATRHIIPSKPLHANVPLKWPSEETGTLEEMERQLRGSFLKKNYT